jgi:hypothetical protein
MKINPKTSFAEWVKNPESRLHLPHFYWSEEWQAWREYLLEHKLYGKYRGKPHEQRMIERMRGKYNDVRFVQKCAVKYADEYAVFLAVWRITNARR